MAQDGQQDADDPASRSPSAENPPAGSPPPQDAAPPRPASGADEVFIPSEELAADEEVTFPVDI
jgi:hypothetical protein